MIEEIQLTISLWAEETFGKSPIMRSVSRANEEMAELIKHFSCTLNNEESRLKAMQEIADIAITLYVLSQRIGGDLRYHINWKMETNRQRKWVIDGYGCGYHIKEEL